MKLLSVRRLPAFLLLLITHAQSLRSQTIIIDGNAGGKRFDGIGAVSGGGATSVLLKDYPEPQRSQVLDLLFKPNFGASISALLVEVPGDGNSTQGSEPSHMHTKSDENYSRGYEWWLLSEAKKRNPVLTLDANGWSCPAWIGNGKFWSQDMCDYYVKWIKGLKKEYGLTLDAIGCRNESGVNEDFVKKLRATLNINDLSAVKIHGFDNWGDKKFDWVKDMRTDSVLRSSVDVISAHTMSEIKTPAEVMQLSRELGKPIWNTEEHVYKEGFDCEISLVESFNKNYIESGATKIVNWYLVGATYGIEPFPETPAMMIAREPWSGNYYTRPALWGYAHYGQFTRAGWQYVNEACGQFKSGGTYVTLKSPDQDYSIIIETKEAKSNQTIQFRITGGLSTGNLCVWRSNEKEQFTTLGTITPVNGMFTITLEPQSIYSISTTTGQRKGAFKNIPPSGHFPFPYYETFEEYKSPRAWGYLPRYTADIAGVFEIADRTDKKGKCLRQVIGDKAQSWAPEWMPYTILGDPDWKDYEVSADIYIENEGYAGIMGHVTGTGEGYGCQPTGYYLTLSAGGECGLYRTNEKERKDTGILLASGRPAGISPHQWHTLRLRFAASSITGFVDNVQVVTATDSIFSNGMVGLLTGREANKQCTAQFDNLLITPLGKVTAIPAAFPKQVHALYK